MYVEKNINLLGSEPFAKSRVLQLLCRTCFQPQIGGNIPYAAGSTVFRRCGKYPLSDACRPPNSGASVIRPTPPPLERCSSWVRHNRRLARVAQRISWLQFRSITCGDGTMLQTLRYSPVRLQLASKQFLNFPAVDFSVPIIRQLRQHHPVRRHHIRRQRPAQLTTNFRKA